ncbi:M10 family metallopeptidase C-terminal domain-containing protein [Caulobacter sp.]|uniref:M10 family metallopeptidase C-terminal domain-containing protein n=1 Tax=Caulobacter sp. TaxID=78 RepID=UPI001B17C0F9|nr:M10 family metallopeptidase C-terminal domain-containing protein [Caulobacter sp.]MBO9544000.1 calcium-binding protein [Caulobacter sp.]
MATLQVLETAYSDVSRIKFSNIPTADLAKLQTLASQVDAATLSLADAQAEIGKMVATTTSVATLSYAFFAGYTPKMSGIDYLVSPTGGNANNLNAAYYQSFNSDNRYINFAVNLGKNGEGAARFSAAYGGLSMADATAKAYAEIFGFTPSAAKVDELLNSQVPNGLGGTYTRAEYFAAYGGDGAGGIGAKAAMVGWLLSAAAKEDIGSYAKANDAFLADLANDGQAVFFTDLLGTYGQQPTYAAGATIAVTANQSVAPDATDSTLRSTANNDTVTGADLNGSVVVAGGHDTVTFSGAVSGYIDGGDGNDTITVAQLNAAVDVLGGAPNGKISGGAGNDVITVTRMINGAIVDGGAGDDTLVMGSTDTAVDKIKVTNVEHLVLESFKPSYTVPAGTFTPPLVVSGYTGLQDITLRASTTSTRLDNINWGVALKMDGVSGGTLTANYNTDLVFTGSSSRSVGAPVVHAYLNGVTSSNASPTNLYVTNNDGALILHVQSDSVLGAVTSQNTNFVAGAIVVTGTGRLTAAFNSHIVGSSAVLTANLDASASAGIDVTEFGGSNVSTAVLSGYNDSIAVDLRFQTTSSITLGGGSDTFKLYQDGIAAPRFSNLRIEDSKVTAYATITDFAKGVDHIDLTSAVPSVVTGLAVGSATTLEQALINVSTLVAPNATGVFEYNGDTYIYHQDGTLGANSGDGLIRLIGVTGLTVGTAAANVDIHYG